MQTASAARAPWAAVVGLALDQLVAWGAFYYCYSVLAVPMARDLGLATSTVAAWFSCSLLVSALFAPRVGQLLDRNGARPVLLFGAALGPLALAGIAVARSELWLLLLFAALGAAQASSLYEPAFRAVVAWFPGARQRSRALLVLTCVGGLASAVFLPLTAFLLDRFGWRTALLILAAIAAGVTFPIRLCLPRSTPCARHPEPRTGSVVEREAFVEGKAFAGLLSAGFALQTFAATGATVCLVWLLVERGETLEAAAALAGLAGASQVPGRLLLSSLGSVLSTGVRLPALLAIQGAAVLGIATLTGPPLVASLMAFGAAAGVMTLERAAVVIEWFGPESFGARSGHLAASSSFARAGAPFAIELLHGTFSHGVVLALLAACFLGSGALLGLAANNTLRSWFENIRTNTC